jgi:hypothetical protein
MMHAKSLLSLADNLDSKHMQPGSMGERDRERASLSLKPRTAIHISNCVPCSSLAEQSIMSITRVSKSVSITVTSFFHVRRPRLRTNNGADVTPARIFSGPPTSARPRFSLSRLCPARPRVTRSHFNSLPVVLPPPSSPPLPAACAPQSASGPSNPYNYVTSHTPTCSCLSLPTANEDAQPPLTQTRDHQHPALRPLCPLTVTLTSYGGSHTVGL